MKQKKILKISCTSITYVFHVHPQKVFLSNMQTILFTCNVHVQKRMHVKEHFKNILKINLINLSLSLRSEHV